MSLLTSSHTAQHARALSRFAKCTATVMFSRHIQMSQTVPIASGLHVTRRDSRRATASAGMPESRTSTPSTANRCLVGVSISLAPEQTFQQLRAARRPLTPPHPRSHPAAPSKARHPSRRHCSRMPRPRQRQPRSTRSASSPDRSPGSPIFDRSQFPSPPFQMRHTSAGSVSSRSDDVATKPTISQDTNPIRQARTPRLILCEM